ncbi:hypothetical protein ILYODFUR_003914 [Ilyodon furcidens]|uniref:Uncharacterized protein n=1 Tax=Ilyodon furcidens TaxID=33524 RepID=A0ABV0TIB5_9TELE
MFFQAIGQELGRFSILVWGAHRPKPPPPSTQSWRNINPSRVLCMGYLLGWEAFCGACRTVFVVIIQTHLILI